MVCWHVLFFAATLQHSFLKLLMCVVGCGGGGAKDVCHQMTSTCCNQPGSVCKANKMRTSGWFVPCCDVSLVSSDWYGCLLNHPLSPARMRCYYRVYFLHHSFICPLIPNLKQQLLTSDVAAVESDGISSSLSDCVQKVLSSLVRKIPIWSILYAALGNSITVSSHHKNVFPINILQLITPLFTRLSYIQTD